MNNEEKTKEIIKSLRNAMIEDYFIKKFRDIFSRVFLNYYVDDFKVIKILVIEYSIYDKDNNRLERAIRFEKCNLDEIDLLNSLSSNEIEYNKKNCLKNYKCFEINPEQKIIEEYINYEIPKVKKLK